MSKKKEIIYIDVEEDEEEYEEPDPHNYKPYQPTLHIQDLAEFIHRLFPKKSSTWPKKDVEYLGNLMANRDGFNSSNRAAIAAAGIAGKIDWFYREYVDLYETNREFEKMIDPWYIIVDPAGIAAVGDEAYITALNNAETHLGGGGLPNEADAVIMFNQDRNWFLMLPTGRETAMRVRSFLHGAVNNESFHTIVMDGRLIDYV